jgi:hypothetical protein
MEISNFLKNLLGKLPLDTIIRDYIVNFFKEKGISIDRKSIKVQKSNLIFLDISPIMKTKILPLYPDILNGINTVLQEKSIGIVIKKII